MSATELSPETNERAEQMVTKRSYDYAALCGEYFTLTSAIRECTRKIRAERCPGESAAEYDDDNGMCISPGGMSCLSGFYQANDIGMGVGDALVAVEECPVCSVKRVEVDKRKELRHRLSGLKRRISNAGRAVRLQAELLEKEGDKR